MATDNLSGSTQTDVRDFGNVETEPFRWAPQTAKISSGEAKQKRRLSQRNVDAINKWPSGPPDSYVDRVPIEDSEHIWQTISGKKAQDSTDFLRVYCLFDRPPSLDKVLSWRRAWTSWSYEGGYPSFSKFLKLAGRTRKSRCRFLISDLDLTAGKTEEYLFRDSAVDRGLDDLWENIKQRPMWAKQKSTTAITRIMQIVDLSPMVLACIIGSTPRVDVSYVASFVDRHLKFMNWGMANLNKFRDLGWSTYTLEYHFAFYHVSLDYVDPESVQHDPRDWRRSASFGREKEGCTRHIHETTLSFLLVGHFSDLSTCIQMEEAYYKDPYAKDTGSRSFRPFDASQPSAMRLLSWVAVALYHVSWRWQCAIDAVDSEITFPAEVVFSRDRTVLMTDDPKFSHAKTYYWALQTYTLFEQTLNDTIKTWENFEMKSLPRLQHSKLDKREWDVKIENIQACMAELQNKRVRIKERIEHVKDLREGLASASALFDSRAAIRQGDNIRLLTYVNLLFLPLSFGTSIFGMQIMGSGHGTVRAFAITLPSIFIGTVFLIMNLQNVLNAWDTVTGGTAIWLLRNMRHHRRQDWKQRAIQVEEDVAATRTPVLKARRKTGGWVYLMFIFEVVLVGIPANEVLVAREYCISLLEKIRHPCRMPKSIDNLESGPIDPTEGAQASIRKMLVRERAQNLRDKYDKGARKREDLAYWTSKVVLGALNGILIMTRILFLPIWIPLLVIVYLLLVIYLQWAPSPKYQTISQEPELKPNVLSQSPWAHACQTLGLDFLLPSSAPLPALAPIPSEEDVTPSKLIRKATQTKRTRRPSIISIEKAKRVGKIGKGNLTVDLAPVRESAEENRGKIGPVSPSSPRPLSQISMPDSAGARSS
ncbi:hypothetical protein BU16DRAFT_505802 [Lophium mytilinum]|uniref:Cora-domain-containing protein n=1 Tax=Lophium mytilinum TaxID=390894 RepID=A0A6A6R220_9PEZI|nr:hypothetical protein BU16DRAFT_505802 [Lophium mytilinum]